MREVTADMFEDLLSRSELRGFSPKRSEEDLGRDLSCWGGRQHPQPPPAPRLHSDCLARVNGRWAVRAEHESEHDPDCLAARQWGRVLMFHDDLNAHPACVYSLMKVGERRCRASLCLVGSSSGVSTGGWPVSLNVWQPCVCSECLCVRLRALEWVASGGEGHYERFSFSCLYCCGESSCFRLVIMHELWHSGQDFGWILFVYLQLTK